MMIEANDLGKQYGYKAALRGVSLQVAQGEFAALVGPNGSGKTTLLRILAGLTRPSVGAVRIAGRRLQGGQADVRRLIGFVGHQPMLYGELTAQENLRFFARLYSLPRAAARTEDVLELIGLAAARAEPVRAFSRGMQQRLAIGRAILHRPQVLLLDEPHTGLDQQAAAMLDELLTDVAAQGRTVLMSSHELSRAHTLAERVEVLAQGEIAASIATDRVSSQELMQLYREATHA